MFHDGFINMTTSKQYGAIKWTTVCGGGWSEGLVGVWVCVIVQRRIKKYNKVVQSAFIPALPAPSLAVSRSRRASRALHLEHSQHYAYRDLCYACD